jgi:mannose-1-phosphate guanylyltransferase
LAQTLARIEGWVPLERRLLTVPEDLRPVFAGELDTGAVGGMVCEPVARGTGPALLLASAQVAARDADAVVVHTPADQWVADTAAWRAAVAKACELAARGFLALIGIRLREPDPGLGYIVPGRRMHAFGTHVHSFREKPDYDEATQLVRRGALANGGIFVWRARTFLDTVAELRPDWYAAVSQGRAELGAFELLRPGSVDREIIERVPDRLAVVELDCDWDDLGTWPRLRERMLRLGLTRADAPFVWTDGAVVTAQGRPDDAVVVVGNCMWVTSTDGLAQLAVDCEAAEPV